MSYEGSTNYFRNKLVLWGSTPPHYDAKRYIASKKKPGLIQEFRSEPLFRNVVCPYLANYARGKERDALVSMFRDAVALFEGNIIPVEIDILIGAVLEACGYRKRGSGLLWLAIGAVILAAIAGAAISAGAGKRRR